MSIINSQGGFLIDCRECDAPDCRGCNIYTLATALGQGKLDWMKDEKNGIRIPLNLEPVKVAAEVHLHEAGAVSDIYNDTTRTAMEILRERIWKTLVESKALRIMRHRSQTAAEDTYRATLYVMPGGEDRNNV